jgi:hypothetical protein
MSASQDTVKRAAALLDRADELRAEAREVLDPLDKARGWRGASDPLSGLMNFDLPKRSSLPALKSMRRQGLSKAAQELDSRGISIAVVPTGRKTGSR